MSYEQSSIGGGGGGGGTPGGSNGQLQINNSGAFGGIANNTDSIPESGSPTNKWFTSARAIASALTGFVSGAGTVSATDTILQAIQKIVGNIALLAAKASPTFTGQALFNTLGFTLHDNGNSGSSITIDLGVNGQLQKVTATANCAVTLTPPTNAGTFIIKVYQTGSNAFNFTWAVTGGTFRWAGGVVPSLSPATGSTLCDVFTFNWDGAEMIGACSSPNSI